MIEVNIISGVMKKWGGLHLWGTLFQNPDPHLTAREAKTPFRASGQLEAASVMKSKGRPRNPQAMGCSVAPSVGPGTKAGMDADHGEIQTRSN